jgi:Tol biopolymer transport system component
MYRNGNDLGRIGSPADYEPNSGQLSLDGTKLLTARSRAGLGTYDIVRLDLVTERDERLTSNPGSEITPVWIDSERAILYAGDSDGRVPHLFRKDLATDAEQAVLPAGNQQVVSDVFPDGRVAYAERSGGKFQMFQLRLNPGARPVSLLQSPLNTSGMRLSPDGQTMTFVGTGEAGPSVYVAPVSGKQPLILAVEGERISPRWSADGRQIFYVGRDNWMTALEVQTGSSLKVGAAKKLFKLSGPATLLDVSRDGRFLLLLHLVRANERPIVVDIAAIASTGR